MQNPAQQVAELTALHTWISQLKAAWQLPPQPIAAPIAPPVATPVAALIPPVLFVQPEAVNKVKEAALAARESNKKITLLKIVPGFKASPLNICESPFLL